MEREIQFNTSTFGGFEKKQVVDYIYNLFETIDKDKIEHDAEIENLMTSIKAIEEKYSGAVEEINSLKENLAISQAETQQESVKVSEAKEANKELQAKIKESEDTAQEYILNAQKQANEIILSAQDQANFIIREANDTVYTSTSAALASANQQSLDRINQAFAYAKTIMEDIAKTSAVADEHFNSIAKQVAQLDEATVKMANLKAAPPKPPIAPEEMTAEEKKQFSIADPVEFGYTEPEPKAEDIPKDSPDIYVPDELEELKLELELEKEEVAKSVKEEKVEDSGAEPDFPSLNPPQYQKK